MRLKVSQSDKAAHTDVCTALGWSVLNELYTCSDDQTIQKWSLSGEHEGKVCSLGAFVTCLHWFPIASKKQSAGAADLLVVACTDGTYKLLTKAGRVERSVDAHRGAVTCIKWSCDGGAIASAGEDGQVKVWSKKGESRSTIAQTGVPVYALAWAADSEQVLFSSGGELVIRSLQSSSKEVRWKAHDATVLALDWSPISGLIVSGAEDCKYKVWDSYGRPLYQSSAFEHSITSLAWTPGGDRFAVGSYNCLALCDKMGWMHSKAHTASGSLFSLAWASDGMQVAAGGGTGGVDFAAVVEVEAEDGRVHAVLEDSKRAVAHDVVGGGREELDFRDRVVNMALGYGRLVVATPSQCHVYSTSNWNTPTIFDLKDSLRLLQLSERCMLTLDNVGGLQIWTYEGRPLCSPKFPGLRIEFLDQQTVSLSSDTLAVLEHAGSCSLRFFDSAQGRQLGEPFTHSLDVRAVALSQAGTAASRQLAFIDRNRDLHLLDVGSRAVVKLASMVDSAVWHDASNMLAAVADDKLLVWHCPAAAFIDPDLLPATRVVRDDAAELGKGAQVVVFTGARCLLKRRDGAQVALAVAPYPASLHELVRTGQWDGATRLCRFVKDHCLWACLAALAMAAKELDTAEVAFAALGELDKLQYVCKVKSIPSEEGRAAALAVYRRQPAEAEALLLGAGLVYRAVKLNVKLFRWQRALELAQKHRQHVDTVLLYRSRYLKSCGQQEQLAAFQQYASQYADLDAGAIKDQVRQDKEQEAARPGARRLA